MAFLILFLLYPTLITLSGFPRPCCLVPILIEGTCKKGVSIIPLLEFPTIALEFFNKLMYFSDGIVGYWRIFVFFNIFEIFLEPASAFPYITMA